MSYIDEVALLQVEVAVVRLYEHTPSMAEMLSFAADLRFAPMSLSPINRTVDGGAVEFDYLAVNTRLGARGSEPSPR